MRDAEEYKVHNGQNDTGIKAKMSLRKTVSVEKR